MGSVEVDDRLSCRTSQSSMLAHGSTARVIVRHASLTGFRAYRARSLLLHFRHVAAVVVGGKRFAVGGPLASQSSGSRVAPSAFFMFCGSPCGSQAAFLSEQPCF